MIDGSSLTIEQVRRVAEDAAPGAAEPQARERVAPAAPRWKRIVNDGCSIYGGEHRFGASRALKFLATSCTSFSATSL
jgi:histidine ammonia-lyase